MIKHTIRIDEDRLERADIDDFDKVLQNDTEPLVGLFSGYFKGLLNINHASIVPRWLAVLPLCAYLTERKRHGHEWRIRALPASELQFLHQYFLLSQFCDWNTQTMVNAFAREAMAEARAGKAFPLEKIRAIAMEKNRTGDLREYQLLSQRWLAAKVLMPSRSYVFHENKPQMDHLFPLAGGDEAYQEAVDVLWNLQPMPAEVNNYKRAHMPKEFFQSKDGSKYCASYDFIPNADDPLWDDHLAFVEYRKTKMLEALNQLYGMQVV